MLPAIVVNHWFMLLYDCSESLVYMLNSFLLLSRIPDINARKGYISQLYKQLEIAQANVYIKVCAVCKSVWQ